MALVDFVYRCPECGHDPMSGEDDWARCSACHVRVERARRDLVVKSARGDVLRRATAKAVGDAVERHGGPWGRGAEAFRARGYEAAAMVSWRMDEEAIRRGGRLVGFAERMGPATPGSIRVNPSRVEIRDGTARGWEHLEIRSMQATSSSLQLSFPGDRLAQLAFVADSPRRWETLMRGLIAEAHRRAGRGEVLEFQPRIVTEAR